MEEELSVTDLSSNFLENLRLALTLDLEDSEALDGLICACVKAVGFDQVTLSIAFNERRDFDAHASVDVLNRVDCVLAIESGKKQA